MDGFLRRSAARFAVCAAAVFTIGSARAQVGAYRADSESLKQHEAAPEWFRDAKFGIYFHWGVYSVPAFGSEWYPRNMHLRDRPEYRHHVTTYGEPSAFGYHDFVPMFTAEHFAADEWAELFRKSGARFAGPVAEHHDGYSMWASKLTPWNVLDTGPKRDITGELEKAVRARGMRFVATFHHARNNQHRVRRGDRLVWTGHYPREEGWPTVSEDPKLRMLYGNIPRDEFLRLWVGKLQEVIDAYRPDLIWFDSWLDEIPEDVRNEFLAYYFNRAREWDRDVVVTCKQQDITTDIAVEDFEKGRADRLTELPWLTDDTISKGSWCYTENLAIKQAEEVIHVLADIVSKNGQLLLNVSPKADGTIPADQREVLLAIGRWLETCGEAIYDTRPWRTYGEGPTKMAKGGHFVGSVRYGAGDIRYTAGKDGKTLYAILLGWPDSRRITLNSVRAAATPAAAASLLGHDAPLPVALNASGQPVVTLPDLAPGDRPCEHAYVIRLAGYETDLHPDALLELPGSILLSADKAVIEGTQLATEEKYGRVNLGFWDRPQEKAHWLAWFSEPGTYVFRGEFAAGAGATRIALDVAGRSLTADVPASPDWGSPASVPLGEVPIREPGVYRVTLRAAEPDSWRAVNVYAIRAARKP